MGTTNTVLTVSVFKETYKVFLAHTHFTFQGFELVVLPVPQAASVVVSDPDREVRVRAVGGLQGEVSG